MSAPPAHLHDNGLLAQHMPLRAQGSSRKASRGRIARASPSWASAHCRQRPCRLQRRMAQCGNRPLRGRSLTSAQAQPAVGAGSFLPSRCKAVVATSIEPSLRPAAARLAAARLISPPQHRARHRAIHVWRFNMARRQTVELRFIGPARSHCSTFMWHGRFFSGSLRSSAFIPDHALSRESWRLIFHCDRNRHYRHTVGSMRAEEAKVRRFQASHFRIRLPLRLSRQNGLVAMTKVVNRRAQHWRQHDLRAFAARCFRRSIRRALMAALRDVRNSRTRRRR